MPERVFIIFKNMNTDSLCPKCKTPNREGAVYCKICGERLKVLKETPVQDAANIYAYFPLSTLALLFPPFGIFAMLNSSKVKPLIEERKLGRAKKASKRAKFWGLLALPFVAGELILLLSL